MTIDARTLGLVLGAVACSVTGQLLLKAGARHLAGHDRLGFLLAAARDAHVLSGIAAWGAATLCWLFVLRAAPLARVYGLTSLTYVLVPLASAHLFGEPLRRLHGVGTALILVGVACLLLGD